MKPNQFYQAAKAARPELSGYQFRPAGHVVPPPKREYKQPDRSVEDALMQALDQWLDIHKIVAGHFYEKQYETALVLTRNIRATPDNIHSVLIANREKYRERMKKHPDAGIFLSAIYNQSDTTLINFDIDTTYLFDTRLDDIGFHLPPEKTLINTGHVGYGFGRKAEGCLINYGLAHGDMAEAATGLVINSGETFSYFGESARGPLINFGRVETGFGFHAYGPVINCGDAETIGQTDAEWEKNGLKFCSDMVIAVRNPKKFYIGDSRPKVLLKQKESQKLPELLDYFNKLKTKVEAGRADHSILTTLPTGKAIKNDLRAILRRAGKL